MANMDVRPQGPVKFFKYKVTYHLKTGDFQELVPNAAQEGVIDAALATLQNALSPSSSVSSINIKIGDKKDTA